MKSSLLPGLHSCKIYSPLGRPVTSFSTSGETSGLKPVPPPGTRTNRFVIGVVKCDPGRKESAPLCGVHLSKAIQKPNAVGGSVYCYLINLEYEKQKGEHVYRETNQKSPAFVWELVLERHLNIVDDIRIIVFRNYGNAEANSKICTAVIRSQTIPSPPM